jgi:hypothetical protein
MPCRRRALTENEHSNYFVRCACASRWRRLTWGPRTSCFQSTLLCWHPSIWPADASARPRGSARGSGDTHEHSYSCSCVRRMPACRRAAADFLVRNKRVCCECRVAPEVCCFGPGKPIMQGISIIINAWSLVACRLSRSSVVDLGVN